MFISAARASGAVKLADKAATVVTTGVNNARGKNRWELLIEILAAGLEGRFHTVPTVTC
jgi:hypothetical protein